MRNVLVIYFLGINLVAFAIFGIDKRKAIKGKWRIKERDLFLSALLGGAIGAILGMRFYRHKTNKWYFKRGIPLILILQICIVIYLCSKKIISM